MGDEDDFWVGYDWQGKHATPFGQDAVLAVANDEPDLEDRREEIRYYNYLFHRYREAGEYPTKKDSPYYPEVEPYKIRRGEWWGHPYPREGKPNPREYNPKIPWKQEPYSIYNQATLEINNEPSMRLYEHQSFEKLRRRYNDTRSYFSIQSAERSDGSRWLIGKVLGFSIYSLTIRLDYWPPPGKGGHRSMVVKVPVKTTIPSVTNDGEGPFEFRLMRKELKNIKRLQKAAHIIQAVDRADVGIPRQRYIPDDDPELYYDSSDNLSSGDESPADEPPPPTATRRELLDQGGYYPQKWHRQYEKFDQRSQDDKKRRIWLASRFDRPEPPKSLIGDDPYDENRRDYILFDFMEHGDLATLIHRMRLLNERAPNRVLWSFFLCMVKSCIALQYPPRIHHPKKREVIGPALAQLEARYARLGINEPGNAAKLVGKDLFEELPRPSRRWAGARYVHFDIEPRNILIGDVDVNAEDGEHAIIPRLKLADFPLMRKIRPNKANDFYTASRVHGKMGFLAPEQFGEDWEFVDLTHLAGPELSEQPVAGNYGPWTNLWGIGMVMWCLITQLRAPMPPQKGPEEPGDEYLSPNYCPLLFDNEEFGYVDITLRRLVRECLRHNPEDRLTLPELLPIVEEGARKTFYKESDRRITHWVKKLVCTEKDPYLKRCHPRDKPPPVPVADYTNDALQNRNLDPWLAGGGPGLGGPAGYFPPHPVDWVDPDLSDSPPPSSYDGDGDDNDDDGGDGGGGGGGGGGAPDDGGDGGVGGGGGSGKDKDKEKATEGGTGDKLVTDDFHDPGEWLNQFGAPMPPPGSESTSITNPPSPGSIERRKSRLAKWQGASLPPHLPPIPASPPGGPSQAGTSQGGGPSLTIQDLIAAASAEVPVVTTPPPRPASPIGNQPPSGGAPMGFPELPPLERFFDPWGREVDPSLAPHAFPRRQWWGPWGQDMTPYDSWGRRLPTWIDPYGRAFSPRVGELPLRATWVDPYGLAQNQNRDITRPRGPWIDPWGRTATPPAGQENAQIQVQWVDPSWSTVAAPEGDGISPATFLGAPQPPVTSPTITTAATQTTPGDTSPRPTGAGRVRPSTAAWNAASRAIGDAVSRATRPPRRPEVSDITIAGPPYSRIPPAPTAPAEGSASGSGVNRPRPKRNIFSFLPGRNAGRRR
ncbi:uncharacterized protein F4822DRAFT_444393 [Hypoxylon trugodes]|uniref:uncharacterized protein n=1 Tax=Hypoxylon trugodes TaxID=326681 RepID=UPI0021933C10|nr:uncharacterized protein F4822DRAFT_444393 [Hypoxylon trugodes]KAI1387855.1 hypothetical protein F4822DRAFT_444393 [Hypoxylon trugodes]